MKGRGGGVNRHLLQDVNVGQGEECCATNVYTSEGVAACLMHRKRGGIHIALRVITSEMYNCLARAFRYWNMRDTLL